MRRAFWVVVVVLFFLGIVPAMVIRLPYWIVRASQRLSNLFMAPYEVAKRLAVTGRPWHAEPLAPRVNRRKGESLFKVVRR